MRTPSAPFEPMRIRGDSVTVDVSANTMVIPTGNNYSLLYNNQYTLTPGRTPPSNGTYTFTDDQDNDTGLQNMIYPWIACFDSSGKDIDFFLFTNRPKNFKYTVSSGKITQLVLCPGNGLVYHGSIVHSNLTLDTDLDLIPNCLEPNVIGSVAYFLRSYRFVDEIVEPIIQTNNFVNADGANFITADGKQFTVRA